jgi:tetratricopeptide (TPR) repeat protein
MEDKIIEKYLYAVEKVQEAERMRISQDDFGAIVEATGLTAAELRIVQEECGRMASQGETYYKSGNYPKAAELLARSMDIDPYNLNNLMLALHTNVQAYLQKPEDSYVARIKDYTQRGMNLDPKQVYFAQVETEFARFKPLNKAREKAKVWAIVSTIALVAAIAFIIFVVISEFDNQDMPLSFIIALLTVVGTGGLAILAWGSWLYNFICYSNQRSRLAQLNYQKGITANPIMDKITEVFKRFF